MKVLAYYLPQFHPVPENDRWWGKGFTEWTSVGKAKPLFKGHVQPKVPGELGYYDLRLPQVRQAQASLAESHGVSAFCYWHYWFGNGKRLLEKPFQEVLSSKTPDFPFCLAWANDSWRKKTWNSETRWNDKGLLVEQKYLGIEDHARHFRALSDAFKDRRYFRLDGKAVFVVYDPLGIPDCVDFLSLWKDLASKEAIGEFCFVGHTFEPSKVETIRKLGFDRVNLSLHHAPFPNPKKLVNKCLRHLKRRFLKKPAVVEYSKAVQYFNNDLNSREHVIPTLIPNWDHTPRSGARGRLFHDCTPEIFKLHARDILSSCKNKSESDQVVFIKSWNEWGEGNYMEPDILHGRAFLEALKDELELYDFEFSKKSS
jgi:hypothetical protein